ncbi:MAG: ABC transporter permease subunit [Candidatus Thermoplasmatota archaeon]|jgi:ABC-2 type transport system permease protein|nr:ABC transporter permease subunit [Candidatus Thermoplasmatota archaeon]
MKPVFYEIQRSLTGKFSIVMIVVIIGLSALISYEIGSISTARSIGGGGVSEVTGYYAVGDNLTLISYFYDAHGSPASNIIVNASLNGTVYPGAETSPGIFHFKITTQSPASVVDLNYSYKQFGFRTSVSSYVTVNTLRLNYSGLDVVPGIFNPSNSSNLGYMLFYVGATGDHTAPPLKVTLVSINSTKGSSSFNTTNVSKDQYSNFTYNVVFPNLGASAIGKEYGVSIEGNSSTSVPINYFTVLGPLSVFAPYKTSTIESSFFSGEGSILIIFIPLLSVFMAYFTYGKDRVTGVLESVLKRPITKGEAIRSRFLANAVVVAASIIIAIIVSDLISYRYYHVFMPMTFLLQVSWAYSTVGISFLAISYFFSHILKSQGALLGSLIGVFMVFSLFWGVIFDVLVSVFGITSGTSTYISFQVAFDYASPSGYASLLQLYIIHTLGGFSSLGGRVQSINPATYGVTPILLVISAVLWIAVPFLLAHELAVKRD